MVILALQFFTQYFEYIPKAALAAVIVSAILFMVEYNVVKPMWRAKSKYRRGARAGDSIQSYIIMYQIFDCTCGVLVICALSVEGSIPIQGHCSILRYSGIRRAVSLSYMFLKSVTILDLRRS